MGTARRRCRAAYRSLYAASSSSASHSVANLLSDRTGYGGLPFTGQFENLGQHAIYSNYLSNNVNRVLLSVRGGFGLYGGGALCGQTGFASLLRRI